MKKLLAALIIAFSGLVSAQVPVGGLPAATTPLSGTEQVPLAQQAAGCPASGCSRQATTAQIAALAAGGVTSFSAGTTGLTPSSPTLGAIVLGGTLAVPSGGTGLGTLTTHGILLGEGTGNVSAVAAMSLDTLLQGKGAAADPAAVSVPNCGSTTTALSYSTGTHTFGCQTVGGSPGGANTNVQFNNSGAFAGANDFSWLSGSDTLLLGSVALPPIVVANSVAATANGIALTVNGGPGGSSSGNGAALNLNGGTTSANANTTASNGGAVVITGGPGAHSAGSTVTTGNGGAITIQGGLGAGSAGATSTGNGGSVSITAGSADLSNSAIGNGGNVTIAAGVGEGSGTPKNGGSVTITAGNGFVGTDVPGNVTISAGTSATVGQTLIQAGNARLLLQQQGTPEWLLGHAAVAGNRLTGTTSGGVQLGAPTGGDCGAGCFNAQAIKVNNVATCLSNGTNCPAFVTSVTGGTGITASPNPIVSTGTLTVDQTFSPTWTGTHTFSSLAGNGATAFQGANTGAGYNIKFRDTTNSVDRGFIGLGTTTIAGMAVTDFGIASGASGSVVIGTANGAAIGTRFGPSGNVTINAPSSGAALTINGTAETFKFIGTGSSYLSLNDGVNVRGYLGWGSGLLTGAAITDTILRSEALLKFAANGNTEAMRIDGSTPQIQARGPIAAALVDMTPDTGTVTLTLTGCTTSPTTAARFYRIGKIVVLNLPKQTCTSNATSFSVTGLAASLTPVTSADTLYAIGPMQDNSSETATNFASVNNAGTITFFKGGSAAGNWTNIGTKGIGGTGTTGVAFTYSLN